jgi:hypothetical protein
MVQGRQANSAFQNYVAPRTLDPLNPRTLSSGFVSLEFPRQLLEYFFAIACPLRQLIGPPDRLKAKMEKFPIDSDYQKGYYSILVKLNRSHLHNGNNRTIA